MTSRALADTSLFIANETGRQIEPSGLPEEIALSVITIGVLRAGVLAAGDVSTRERRLRTLTSALELDPIPIDAAVADQWARLSDRGLRMGVNDSWIAATAMTLEVPVVTQDEGFPELDEVRVLRV